MKKLQNNFDEDPPFVAAMANGSTSGDVNNINFLKPRASKPKYAQMRYVAEDAASKSSGALANLTWKNQAAAFAFTYRELDLQRRVIDDELLGYKRPKRISPANRKSPIYRLSTQHVLRNLRKRLPRSRFRYRSSESAIFASAPRHAKRSPKRDSSLNSEAVFASSFMVELAHGSFGYLPTPAFQTRRLRNVAWYQSV
ncbi:MAG: hypothetical protein WKF73_14140 [Nocardioidaceae bacterium]